MRRVRFPCVLILVVGLVDPVLLSSLAAGVETASDDAGNIRVADAAGHTIQLTDSGLDCCPVTSPDGQQIAFVRKTIGKLVDAGFGETEANEIWIVGLKDRHPRMLARGGAGLGAALGSPQFSPDGNRIYFAGASGTQGEVYAIDVHTGAPRFISGGYTVEVVPRGEYRGDLIVQKHKYFLGGGSYDWFWLLKPDGEEIGPLGESTSIFKETFVNSEP